jgi:hypothetical protein
VAGPGSPGAKSDELEKSEEVEEVTSLHHPPNHIPIIEAGSVSGGSDANSGIDDNPSESSVKLKGILGSDDSSIPVQSRRKFALRRCIKELVSRDNWTVLLFVITLYNYLFIPLQVAFELEFVGAILAMEVLSIAVFGVE